MRKLIAACLVTLLVAFAAGCGSSSNSSSSSAGGSSAATQSAATDSSTASTTGLAKTKFALHAGLAFGAVHRYIYKPFRQGRFSGSLFHHKLAVVKGAVAAAFAFHEVRLALNAARSSKLLSTLLSPLLALQTKLGSLRDGLRHGNVDPAAILSANGDTSAIAARSAAKGQPIQDQPTPSLGG